MLFALAIILEKKLLNVLVLDLAAVTQKMMNTKTSVIIKIALTVAGPTTWSNFPATSILLSTGTCFFVFSPVSVGFPLKANMPIAQDGDVIGMEIAILDHVDIKRMAVCKVTETSLHNRGRPRENSVLDIRLGSSGRWQACGTCLQVAPHCPGHLGYMDLPYPIPGVGFLTRMLKMENSVCFYCSALLTPNASVGNVECRLTAHYNEAMAMRKRISRLFCPKCGILQPTITDVQPMIIAKWPADASSAIKHALAEGTTTVTQEQFEAVREKNPFNNWTAYHVLRNIKPDDLRALGVDPDVTTVCGMMFRVLVVPSNVIRPTVEQQDSLTTSQHDVHHHSRRLVEILKMCNTVQQEAEKVDFPLDDPFCQQSMPETVLAPLRYLYFLVSNYMYKDKAKIPNLKLNQFNKDAHSQTTSITEVFEGKQGRWRCNIQAKRDNFTMRSVIIPDPSIDVDEVSIPVELARMVTEPIRVTSWNRDAIRKQLIAGNVKQVLDPQSGTIIDTSPDNCSTEERSNVIIYDGLIAEFYLRNGTIVSFNRQPTLHKLSMMGHRVRIVKEGRTLGMNGCATIPYNADHDGDEMNVHIMQIVAAMTEMELIMHVPRQMLHPANKPSMGLIQDALVGAHMLTRDVVRLDKAHFCDLLSQIRYNPNCSDDIAIQDPASLGTPTIPPPAYPETNEWSGRQVVSALLPNYVNIHTHDGINIVNGEMLSGTLNKKMVGPKDGGVLHHILIYGGTKGYAAARFLSDIHRVANKYMDVVGFTTSYSDTRTPDELHQRSKRVIEEAHAHIAMIRKMAEGYRDHPLVYDALEGKTCEVLRQLLTLVGTLLGNNLPNDNSLQQMNNRIGSKGSTFNLAQTFELVGQTFTNGGRPGVGWDAPRYLPTEPIEGDRDNLEAYAYEQYPFKRGLTPKMMFTNNVGGREGLVDTAIKTSNTGYIARRLIKSMENGHVGRDGTVRDANGHVYQHRFGHDGMDPSRLVRVKYTKLLSPNVEFEDNPFALDLRDRCRKALSTMFHRNLGSSITVFLPFDATTVVDMCGPCTCMHCGDCNVPELIDEGCRRLRELSGTEALYVSFHMQTEFYDRVKTWCSDCIGKAIDTMAQVYEGAMVCAGEAVGAMCATSTGEPATQLTLNCVSYDTKFLVFDGKQCRVVEIGELVESELALSETAVNQQGIAWCPPSQELFVQSCDENGVVEWDIIEGVSSHPCDCIVEVVTESNRKIKVTPGESVLRWDGGKFVTARADELKLGDFMPVTFQSKPPPMVNKTLDMGLTLDCETGFDFGAYCAEKSQITKRISAWFERHGGSNGEQVPDFMFSSSDECVLGFLDGYVSGNGVVGPHAVHTNSHSLFLLEGVANLLCRFGISSRFSVEDTMHSLVILNVVRFYSMIRLTSKTKQLQMEELIRTVTVDPCCFEVNNVMLDRVKSICKMPYTGRVYDLTVSRTRNMQSFNGVNQKDTFHFAGAGKVMIEGVPRLKELIGATRIIGTPVFTVCFKDMSLKAAEELASHLPVLYLKTIVFDAARVHEPDRTVTVIPEDAGLVEEHVPFLKHFETSPFVIRFELHKSEMLSRKITPQAVADMVRDVTGDRCFVAASKTSDCRWVLRIYIYNHIVDVNDILRNSKKGANGKRKKKSSPSDIDESMIDDKLADAVTLYDHHTGKHMPVSIAMLAKDRAAQRLQDILLSTVALCGIPGVTDTAVRTVDETEVCSDTGAVVTVQRIMVDVHGDAVDAVLTLPGKVDLKSFCTNNVMLAYRLFGVDAACQVLFFELQRTMQSAGTRVDPHLLKMICDVMCHNGTVMSMSRFGLNKLVDRSPISSMAFEESVDQLTSAAVFGKTDWLQGVSERIMFGMRVPVGTGLGPIPEHKLAPGLCIESTTMVPSLSTTAIGLHRANEDTIVVVSYCQEMEDDTVEPMFAEDDDVAYWSESEESEVDEEEDPLAPEGLETAWEWRISSPCFEASDNATFQFRISSPVWN